MVFQCANGALAFTRSPRLPQPRKRERWQRHQGALNPKRLVFIDETWTKTNMAPLRGWGRRGDRVKAKAPFAHWNTMYWAPPVRR